MCGRFSLVLQDFDQLREYLVDATEFVFDNYKPRYNAAPSQLLPVVVKRGDSLVVGPMNWGFLPSWSKEPEKGLKPINARSEGIEAKAMYRNAIKRRRCLVPMSGFFEWKTEEPDVEV